MKNSDNKILYPCIQKLISAYEYRRPPSKDCIMPSNYSNI